MVATYVQRLRVTFRKFGPARFIGHLDIARTWERALNRARFPMAYSQGFNQQPKMQFATATPLGTTSDVEIVDLWVTETLDPAAAHEQLMSRMAPGIEVLAVAETPLKGPALQTITKSSTYDVVLLDSADPAEVASQIEQVLAAPELMREKRSKKRTRVYDLRPLIYTIEMINADPEKITLRMHLTLEPSATGRPDEVLKALDIDPLDCRIHRVDLELEAVR